MYDFDSQIEVEEFMGSFSDFLRYCWDLTYDHIHRIYHKRKSWDGCEDDERRYDVFNVEEFKGLILQLRGKGLFNPNVRTHCASGLIIIEELQRTAYLIEIKLINSNKEPYYIHFIDYNLSPREQFYALLSQIENIIKELFIDHRFIRTKEEGLVSQKMIKEQ